MEQFLLLMMIMMALIQLKVMINSTNVTINNFKGGHIYHTSESAVVVAIGSATLTNSGKIENKDGPSQNAITCQLMELLSNINLKG